MNDLMINIGGKIKSLREQSGFTQANIAKYLKVDQSFISKVEKNERLITTDMLERLSALFGITIENFYAEDMEAKQITFALRASEINENDLETISSINRIALNLNFMTKTLDGGHNDR